MTQHRRTGQSLAAHRGTASQCREEKNCRSGAEENTAATVGGIKLRGDEQHRAARLPLEGLLRGLLPSHAERLGRFQLLGLFQSLRFLGCHVCSPFLEMAPLGECIEVKRKSVLCRRSARVRRLQHCLLERRHIPERLFAQFLRDWLLRYFRWHLRSSLRLFETGFVPRSNFSTRGGGHQAHLLQSVHSAQRCFMQLLRGRFLHSLL